MKPLDATTLPVICALSQAAYQDADQILSRELIARGNLGDIIGHTWYILTVPSQLFGMAVVLAFENRCCIMPNFTYTPTEWSLTVSGVDLSTRKPESITVWTEGV